MSYLVYNGKRVISPDGKYVSKITSGPINRLTGWTNISFDTFSSSGADINSAIGLAPNSICESNSYPVIGGNPQYGSVIFKCFLTITSGTPNIVIRKNGLEQTSFPIENYTGPDEYTFEFDQFIEPGDVDIRIDNNADFANVNFSATNCQMYITNGDGNEPPPIN